MGNGDKSNLTLGSHTHSVARLDVGQNHSISRCFDTPELPGQLVDAITKTRRSLAHSATALFGRVRDKMPERSYTVDTGVLIAANKLYVCAVIERIK